MRTKKSLVLFLILLMATLSATQIVSAAAKVPRKIKLNKTKATLYVGDTLKLKARITPSKAKQTVKWTSSNKKVATVSAKGKIKAKAPGKVVITCTSKAKKSVRAKCKITVKKKKNNQGGGSNQSGSDEDGSSQGGNGNNQGESSQNDTTPKKTIQQLDAETLANAKTIITLNGDAMNTWLFGKRAYTKFDDASGNMIWSIVESKDTTVNYIVLYKPGTNDPLGYTDVINNYSDMTLRSDPYGDEIRYDIIKGQYDFKNDPEGATVCWNFWASDLYNKERTKADFETAFNGKISDEIYNKLIGYAEYPIVSGRGKDTVIIYGKNIDGVLTARYAGYYIYKNKTYELIGVASDNPDTYGKVVTW